MNAKAQGREDAKIRRIFVFFAPLRLCVFALNLSLEQISGEFTQARACPVV
jgi:hypothetical protein